jgi:UDP-N-acetylmuramyl tripeptide synthase
LAIMAGKILISLSRLLGNQGTDFPGRVARKIYPGILKELAANIEEEIFIVTGTNGKTTTSNMIAAILKEKGYSLVHNSAGANMLTGVTTAFIQASDIWGRNSFDYALLEVDEAYVPLLIKETRPGLP